MVSIIILKDMTDLRILKSEDIMQRLAFELVASKLGAVSPR